MDATLRLTRAAFGAVQRTSPSLAALASMRARLEHRLGFEWEWLDVTRRLVSFLQADAPRQ